MNSLLRNCLFLLIAAALAACSSTGPAKKASNAAKRLPTRDVRILNTEYLPLIVTNDINGDDFLRGNPIRTLSTAKPGDENRISFKLGSSRDSSLAHVYVSAYWATVEEVSGEYRLIPGDPVNPNLFDTPSSDFINFNGNVDITGVNPTDWKHRRFQFNKTAVANDHTPAQLLVISAYGEGGTTYNPHIYSGSLIYNFKP